MDYIVNYNHCYVDLINVHTILSSTWRDCTITVTNRKISKKLIKNKIICKIIKN